MEAKKIPVIRRKTTGLSLVRTNTVDQGAAREQIREMIQGFLNMLLRYPERSNVSIEQGPKTTVFQLDLVQEDFGRIMGTKGKHIMALRTLVMAAAGSHDFRAIVKIKDEDRFF